MNLFSEIGLKGEILDAISELGFKEPTPIQEKTIPHLLNNKQDLVGLAQTGTGKTAAFGLPIIQQIDSNENHIQSLILCPTRELCLQITKDLKNYSKYIGNIGVVPIYGGASASEQIKQLKNKTHIVVGTPGRVLDLLNRKKLKISQINTLVLDEADEMLSMGFKDDLDTILANTSSEKQALLFSATMPKAIADIARKYMHRPIEISVSKKNIGAENVDHLYYLIHARDRYYALKRIADINPNIYGIVFCRTRRETKEVADKMMQDGYNADALHGDLSQAQRDHVMKKFRLKHLNMLVATDVAARGLDVHDLTHIINYNLPDDPEVYIHRTGRTGRAGKKGIAVTLIHLKEKSKLKAIEKMVGKSFDRKMIPTGKEVCEKQLFNLVDKVEQNVDYDESQIEPFLPEIYKKLSWLSKEDIIKRFVSLEFERFLEYYKDAPDINVSDKKISQEKKSQDNKKVEFTRFFINIGKDHKLKKTDILQLINQKLQKRGVEIGKVEMLNGFSFVEIDSNYQDTFFKSLNHTKFKGKKINVEIAKSQGKKNNKNAGGKRKRKRS
jgi:ATP-dependent RNA helicase DeaD